MSWPNARKGDASWDLAEWPPWYHILASVVNDLRAEMGVVSQLNLHDIFGEHEPQATAWRVTRGYATDALAKDSRCPETRLRHATTTQLQACYTTVSRASRELCSLVFGQRPM